MPPYSDASGSSTASFDAPPGVGFRGFRLAHLPLSARLGITCFIALVGFGYLASLTHLYFTYSKVDGNPTLTADDVRQKLAGKREQTKLESKLVGGSMEKYLTDPAERKVVLGWVDKGAPEADFAPVQAILDKRCITCHAPSKAASFAPLTNFEEVTHVAKKDMGESVPAWARVAHIHLQSLAMIFLALGLLFAFSGAPEMVKILLIPTPFIALVADFGARGLVPKFPNLVYLVMAGGGLGAFSTFSLIILLFVELWFVRRSTRQPVAQA